MVWWALLVVTLLIGACLVDDLVLGDRLDTATVGIFIAPLAAIAAAPVYAWLRVRRSGEEREDCYTCGQPADYRMGTRSYCERHGPRGSHGR